MENYALELRNITKTYPGVVALDKVSLGLKKGEIHALVGENGAGKSTLIKVISGAIAPDEGKIVVEGKEYERMTPALSRQKNFWKAETLRSLQKILNRHGKNLKKQKKPVKRQKKTMQKLMRKQKKPDRNMQQVKKN